MSLTKNYIFFYILLFIGACSTPSELIGPDGTPHFIIRCGHIEQCYKDARKMCDGNYKIINTTTSSDVFNGQGTITQDLLIKCDSKNKK